MKLVIQIPCYNEAKTLTHTCQELPQHLEGIDEIIVLVIDDGSEDNTAEVARSLNCKVLQLPGHKGLAKAFSEGLRYAVSLGADIIVNTDADNQYKATGIAPLIEPILNKKADLVVGCRPISSLSHFSKTKKVLQHLGSRMVTLMTGLDIPDVTTGFRAYSRKLARRLRIFSDFTYTIESLIQATQIGSHIAWIPVEVNPPTRKSRLFHSNWYYIRRQAITLLRIWALYSPVKLFARSGVLFLFAGSMLILRFLFYYISCWPQPSGKIQSLIFAAILLLAGFFMILIGVLADLIAVNRKLIEEIIEHSDQSDSMTNENGNS